MKRLFAFAAVAAAMIWAAGCTPDEKPSDGTIDGPQLEELTLTPEALTVPGQVSFHAVIKDGSVNLSTLEVSAALADGSVLASASIRTAGKESVVDETLDIPFAAGITQGAELIVSFEAINVDGKSVKQVKKLTLSRPQLPETLYAFIGEEPVAMTRDLQNANLYVTPKGEYENIVSFNVATAEDMSAADFIWGASGTDNLGKVCAFSDAAPISVSYPSVLVEQYTFDVVTFEVKAVGEELNVSVGGTKLTPDSGLLYASVSFEKGKEVAITGIENLEAAWNRDFFEKKGDKFTFLRESGTYDVYYSPKYNYIWIVKNGAEAPECLWVVGHGFTEATEWHTDYGAGGWEVEPVTRVGYAVSVGGSKYQVSLYLSNEHEWNTFEFEVYSNLVDGSKAGGFCGKSITGFSKGVKLSVAKDGMPGLTSDTGFQPGYYTIVFDNASGEINLTRHTDWVDAGGSGVVIAGTELEKGETYNFATITFTNGQEVAYSGITKEQLNRDFFRFDGDKAIFQGVSGSYLVQYFPKYEYTWISNENQAFPDAIYLLGSGRWSAPFYYEDDLWDDVAYNRNAPWFTVAPKIGDNKYQATMSMSTSNYNWRVLIEFYSDLWWGQEGVAPVALTGPAASRFYLDGSYLRGVDEKDNPFEAGNYRFVMTAGADGLSIDITKID